MGRRARGGGGGGASSASAVCCPKCHTALPRSAFSKAALNAKSGTGPCRGCQDGIRCAGCQEWRAPSEFQEPHSSAPRCGRCLNNAQIDKLLGTPKDEVTHFGAAAAMRLQREAEYALLLVCVRHELHERLVLKRIMEFLRVPYITSYGGNHYCELCDETFEDILAKRHVRMSCPMNSADWAGCPGQRLRYSPGEGFDVAEFRKVAGERWFFRTQVLQWMLDRGDGQPSQKPWVEDRWAPLSAVAEEGKQPSRLPEHLRSQQHRCLEAALEAGEKCLVNRAALAMAKKRGEDPSVSLSRFRDGMRVSGRFCTPKDVEAASALERVRDLGAPPRVLRDVLGSNEAGRQVLWLSPEEAQRVEEQMHQGKRGSRR